MNEITLAHSFDDEWVSRQASKYLDDSHYQILVKDEDTDVFRPDGSILFKLRTRVLPAEVCRLAFTPLRTATLCDATL